jgi:hypothetical protein
MQEFRRRPYLPSGLCQSLSLGSIHNAPLRIYPVSYI